MVQRDLPGYAIGGLSGGEEKDVFQRIVSLCTDLLPRHKPRYLMGVGCVQRVSHSLVQYQDSLAREGRSPVPRLPSQGGKESSTQTSCSLEVIMVVMCLQLNLLNVHIFHTRITLCIPSMPGLWWTWLCVVLWG